MQSTLFPDVHNYRTIRQRLHDSNQNPLFRHITDKLLNSVERMLLGYSSGSFMAHYNHCASKILYRDNYECVYCNSSENITIDHIIPISQRFKYGLPSGRMVNNDGNLVASCRLCKQKRACKDICSFFEENPGFKENFFIKARYAADWVLESTGLKDEKHEYLSRIRIGGLEEVIKEGALETILGQN
ncbi:MAG: HNH endonuclease [Nanoarchaeota archaeon]